MRCDEDLPQWLQEAPLMCKQLHPNIARKNYASILLLSVGALKCLDA